MSRCCSAMARKVIGKYLDHAGLLSADACEKLSMLLLQLCMVLWGAELL